MYHPLMAVKALTMGSKMVGIARPVLKALINGSEEEAENYLKKYLLNMKRIMFLMGAENLNELKKKKNHLIPTGFAKDWIKARMSI